MSDVMSDTPKNAAPRQLHPVVWLILYLPFGALGGFITVALTFLATQHGLSITEGALIIASQMLVNWLKWIWAPIVDITLTPKRWYVISTALSAVGVFAMSAVPLAKETLGLLLLIIALANVINTVVGMSVEAMIASTTTPEQVGKVSAWFQAGNLGGTGLGGALGLLLIQKLPHAWMSGAIMGGLFMLCCLALLPLPHVASHASDLRPVQAVKKVTTSLWSMLKTREGFLTGFLCMMPVATGAAQGTLTQSAVAAHWGAGADQVELVQGLLAGLITAIGCFMGGWVCDRLKPTIAYSLFGVMLAGAAIAMAVCPATVQMYVIWNMIYALGVGLSYSAFTAMVLGVLGGGAAATGYNVFASLSNFPLWWLGLLLGWMADHRGPGAMLATEAALGILGVALFLGVSRVAGARLGKAAASPALAAQAAMTSAEALSKA
jgi:hypothetical protein